LPDLGAIPGPVVIPDCFQVMLRWTLINGKTVDNVLHGIVSGGVVANSALAQAIYAHIIASAAWTAYKPYINENVTLDGVDLRDVRAANGPIVSSTGAATPGTGVLLALPPEVALVVTLRTDFAGPGFRGRVYLGGFDSAGLAAGGTALAGLVTAAVGFMDEVQTAMGIGGVELAIGQRARAGYTGTTGTVHAARAANVIPVTSIVVRDAIFDSQRRRSD
jgi:hypothetical protein